MTPKQLRDAANTPWEPELKPGAQVEADVQLAAVATPRRFCGECFACKGLGRIYFADFDEDGPRPGFEECAACKGTGKRPR